MTYLMYTVPPKPGEVLTKEEAGYVAKGPFTCKNCFWFEGTGLTAHCDVTGGRVARGGCCDYWRVEDAPQRIGLLKAEYVEVPGAHYTCDECEFFDPIRQTCWPVQGHIEPTGSCNKWMPIARLREASLEGKVPGDQVKNWAVYHECMKDKEDTPENKTKCAKIANAVAAGTINHSDIPMVVSYAAQQAIREVLVDTAPSHD